MGSGRIKPLQALPVHRDTALPPATVYSVQKPQNDASSFSTSWQGLLGGSGPWLQQIVGVLRSPKIPLMKRRAVVLEVTRALKALKNL